MAETADIMKYAYFKKNIVSLYPTKLVLNQAP